VLLTYSVISRHHAATREINPAPRLVTEAPPGSSVYLNPLFRPRFQSTPPASRTSVCAGTATAPGIESGSIQIA
jgi:hypothetical protein